MVTHCFDVFQYEFYSIDRLSVHFLIQALIEVDKKIHCVKLDAGSTQWTSINGFKVPIHINMLGVLIHEPFLL